MIQRWRLAARWHNTRAVLADAIRPVLSFAFGVIFASVIGWLFRSLLRQNLSTAIAVAGLILQWLGLAVVAWGMRSLRQRFKRPSWFGRLWSALQRPHDVTIQLTGAALEASGLAAVTAVGSLANATVEQRLDAVEATTRQLRTDLNEKTQILTTAVDAVKQGVQREADERAAAIRDVLRQLEDVSAGGLQLQSLGLCWLFAGVLFTSVPSEIAACLHNWF